MASRDHYMAVATQISSYMNAFRLAFKTYNVAEFDEMLKAVAGDGARSTGERTSSDLEAALLQRGFVVFPTIASSEDGYVRVIRASSLINNLLNAFRYPGPNGDSELARLLRTVRRRQIDDDLDSESAASS